MDASDIKKDISDALSEGLSKARTQTVTVNYLTIFVLFIAMAASMALTLHTMHRMDAAVARQQAQFEKYSSDLKQMQEQWLAHEKERDALSAQQAAKVEIIHVRDKQTDSKIAQVTSPDRPSQQVVADLKEAYGFDPQTVDAAGATFAFPQLQTFTATKIDRDRLWADLRNTQDVLTLETQKETSCEQDLADSKKKLEEGKKVMSDQQKLLKKSRWKKFGEGALKVGIFVGGVLVGRGL